MPSHFALALACLLVANVAVFAQGVRGTISGTVTDPDGAVIVGATVQIENVATGKILQSQQTGDNGGYTFLEIEPGSYNVIISATGFAETRLLAVGVEPNRNVRLDAAMNVVGSTETVEVTAATELIEKDSATLGTTVDRQRVQGLPLNGRNVLQLAVLQPGVIPTGAGFGNGSGFSVNGARPVENNITLDGANNNEVAVGGTVGFQPRPDAVQEFRLLTSNYDAEFGRNSGAIVNVVTRSGSSEYHGNLRLFYRPTFLSAARYFDKALATDAQREANDNDFRRAFERKEFGGNIGGPIWIPKLYDGREKTFFFFDYEGRRQKIGATATLTGLPLAAERLGDFSGLGRVIRDPATGDPFPGNVIPTDRFSPIAAYYLQFLPTGDATGRATVGGDDITNSDQVTMRFDHYISQDQTINYTFNYFDQSGANAFAFGGSSVPGFGSTDKSTRQNHVIRHTWTLSPTLVNGFMVSYSRNDFPAVLPITTISPREIGFTGNFIINEALAGAPRISLLDRGLVLGNTIQGPQIRVTENFQIQESLSWSKGDHRLKFGFDGTQYLQDQAFLFINQGIFTYSGRFGGNTTGDDLADLLIGNSPIAFQSGNSGERDYAQKYFALFAQDAWRIRDDLTLSFGLRYEYTSPITDDRNRVSFYRPGSTSELLVSGQLIEPQTGAVIGVAPGGRPPNGIVFVGDPDNVLGGTVPEGGVAKDFNNFAPRVGIAYAPYADDGIWRKILGDRETAIRAGFGVYYGYIIGDTALQQLSAPGFNATGAFFFPGSGTLADPFAPDPFPDYRGDQGTLPNPFATTQVFVSAPITNTAQPIDPNIRTPYTYQWNFTIERGFLENYVATVSYVGSRGLKLYVREEVNPALGTFFTTERTIPVPTATNANTRRLNDDVRGGIQQLSSAGTSDFHAFEAQVQRRFADGLLFQLAYTWSKAISDADSQRGTLDLLDRDIGRSLSSFDAPHRFVGSFLWDLPFWKGTTGVVNRLADGWGVGAIATFQSGTPFTVGNLFDTVGTGGGVFSFADIGAPYVQLDPRSNDSRAFNVDAFKPFGDPASGFVLATDFRRGTQAANQYRLNNGVNNWDIIVSKKTRLWGETSNLELRFEAFNAFNHTQFNAIDLNLNNIVLDPVTGKPDPLKSSFGKYTGAAESRVIQLAVRISF
ncbi:MAG: TonB-dependent receptor [Blastocatellia bacterium]|nr:TonB-dependent receptor [Blastocatellia bacterium]